MTIIDFQMAEYFPFPTNVSNGIGIDKHSFIYF